MEFSDLFDGGYDNSTKAGVMPMHLQDRFHSNALLEPFHTGW